MIGQFFPWITNNNLQRQQGDISGQHSFLSEFAFYVVLTVIGIVSLFVWFTQHSYQSYSEHINERVKNISLKVEKSFRDTIDYNEYILSVLSSQIAEDYTDNTKMETILKSFVHVSVLPWTSFSWVDNRKLMLVDSVYGTLKEPLNMESRDYLQQTSRSPQKIFLGTPVIGSTCKRWMIPAGLGVVNKKQEYIGTITTGFDIHSLERMFDVFIGNGIDYLIVDLNLQAIMSSKGEKVNNWLRIEKIKTDLEKLTKNSSPNQVVSEDVENNLSYTLKKTSKYPYIICIFYNKKFILQEMFGVVLSRAVELLLISVLLGVFLILLYIRFMRPLKQLSNMADNISKGYPIDSLPSRTSTYEIGNLTHNLIKLKNLLNKEKSSYARLEKAMKIIKTSDKTKQAFVQKIQFDMQKPLKTILTTVNILARDESGQIDIALQKRAKLKCLENIHLSALEIKTLTTDSLDLSHFSVKDVLKECIEIHAKNIHINRVKIKININKNITNIHGDKTKFKQILVGLISRSLDFSPENSRITIDAEVEEEKSETNRLVIRIADNGFGLDNKDRHAIFEKYSSGLMWGNIIEATNFNVLSVEKAIKLHNGEINFEDDYNVGSVVTLKIPIDQKHPQAKVFPRGDNVIDIKKSAS